MSSERWIRRWAITNVKNRGLEVVLLDGSGPVPGETIQVVPLADYEALKEAMALNELAHVKRHVEAERREADR